MVNLVTLGSVFALIQGTLPEGWFSNIFVLLSIASLVPSLIASLLGPILAVVSAVRSALGWLWSFGAGISAEAADVGATVFSDVVFLERAPSGYSSHSRLERVHSGGSFRVRVAPSS